MFRVYGKPNCPWCVSAQKHIMANFPNESIDYIDITQDAAAKEKILAAGFKTVPQVYSLDAGGNENHIGGFEALQDWTVEYYR